MSVYSWTGPNAFNSTDQSPIVSPAVAGTYTLTVTDANDCSDDADTVVVVNTPPTATASNDGPVCPGEDVQLNGGPGGMASYSWSGPSSFNSTDQSPIVSPAVAGTYTLTVTDANDCSDDADTVVVVNTPPTATASSNSPVCEGDTIVLTGGPGGMGNYSWTGPDGFSSNSQSPTIPSATTAMAGDYILTVIDGGCTSDPATTNVVVNTKPTATATNDGPVCQGEDVQLNGGPGGMASYSWSGPSGYGNTSQSPIVSPAVAGTYTLTVTDANGCSDDASTVVVVELCEPIEATKRDALEVDADDSGDFSPGDTIEYTVVITNSGSGTAQNVVFTDTVDPNTTLVCNLPTTPTTGQGNITCPSGPDTFSVAVGDITAGGNVTITFQVIIDKPLSAGVTQASNQGLVSGSNFVTEPTDDPDTPAEDDPTITPINAVALDPAEKTDSLLIDADGNGVYSPGDTILYEVTIWNEGNMDDTGVIFTDTPDPNTDLVVGTVSTTKGSVTVGNNPGDTSVVVNVGTLQGLGLETVTISFHARIHDPLPPGVNHVYNQAVFYSNEESPVPSDDPDTPTDDDPTETPLRPAPGRGVSAFPSLYMGIVAALGAGILAYFIRRRLTRQE